ncbi:MAG: type IV secretion system DNA-binding domain-containing protein [Alphaproteobacteria bacterium]|nr:type IV secretion system DNA-binding domain-containing protein [Alphaproteobacteria bacterium]
MQNKTVIIGLGVLTSFIIYSCIATLIYNLMNGYTGFPSPLTIWATLFYPMSESTSSQLWVAFGAPIVALMFAGGGLYDFLNNNKFEFADAKWADLPELKKAGLLSNEGVLLGTLKGQYIFSPGDSHTIVSARTRTGKGVGVVIPNLLLWNGSVVCLDIKHENFELTAGYRAAHSGGRVFKWDPLADGMKSHGFNPLDQISEDPMDRIMDIRRIAGILLPVKGRDEFWITEARSLFVGLALYVINQPEETMPSTIGSIYRLLSAEAELGDICRFVVKNHPELNQAIVGTMNRFANKAAKERSGVKSQLDAALETWKYPKIDAATTKSDFQLSELRKQKTSIYICVKAGQIEALTNILRLFFEMLITELSMDLPDPKIEPHKVLIVLDEMHMLGKMEIVKNTFTLSAGYGSRVLAAIQDFSVLDEVYGRDARRTIFSNCDNQIFFRPKVFETAREISSLLGNRMVETTSYSQKQSLNYEPKNKNTSFQEKPLMAPAKVLRMNNNKGILISSNKHPVLFDKIRYFKDQNFKNRILPPPVIEPLPYKTFDIPKFEIANDPPPSKPDPNQYNMLDNMDHLDGSLNLGEYKE